MGERVWFATSNWKDKTSKPSCYTQAQWDARNSSKFNGVPFAGAFALDPSTTKLKATSQADLAAYKNALAQITVPGCSQAEYCPTKSGPPSGYSSRMAYLNQKISELPEIKETDVNISCQDLDMTIWDGSTYYDLSGTTKTWSWNSCCANKPRTLTSGYSSFKAPSKRADVYIPVCGPGTHIQEITKDELMKIVWQVAEFDIQASGFSAHVKNSFSGSGSCGGLGSGSAGSTTSFSRIMECTVTTSNKNLNPSSSSLGKESDIVRLSWAACPKRGYTGNDSRSVSGNGYGNQTYYYEDGPSGTGNGNVTVGATISPQNYQCGTLNASASGSIDVTIKPFTNRQQFIYFVTSGGVEKIYFDPTGLFNFSIVSNGLSYYLNPSNKVAPFSLTLNFLGKTFTLGVDGPPNGTSPLQTGGGPMGNGGSGTQTRNFASGSINITGKKYYPYANSKGEAVYNEDTGAQLKDPLS